MRIKVILKIANKKLNIKYHSMLQGAIYYALLDNGNTDIIHNDGYKLGKRKFKLFTFSEIYGKSEYDNTTKEIEFKENGYFYFSSIKDDVVISFISYLQQNMSMVLGNKKIEIARYEVLNDNQYLNNEVIFSTLSPVTVYKTNEFKKTSYIDPSNEEFKISIINNLAQKYYLIYNENMDNININDISNVKKKIVYFRKTFIIAYHFNITFINLNDKIINVILNTGLGSKNSSGFGMVIVKK